MIVHLHTTVIIIVIYSAENKIVQLLRLKLNSSWHIGWLTDRYI